jgi:mRNA interferase MazF
MPNPKRGDVWIVDLGMAAKIRPCVVLSVPPCDQDRALVTLVADTTSPRGAGFEVPSSAKFLKPGVFDGQDLVTVPLSKLVRPIGVLPADQFQAVCDTVRRWLGL